MTEQENRAYVLEILPLRAAIVRLGCRDPVPDWADGEFVSVTRTVDELSIVCPEDRVPDTASAERGWSCFKVAGCLDFDQIGVIASLAEPLRRAAIPIFVVSTYDTDYLLVKASRLEASIEAMRAAGHEVRRGDP